MISAQTSVTLTLAALLLSGCVSASQGLDEDLAGSIPKGSNLIYLHSDAPPADLYKSLYRRLASAGFEITESNDEMGTLSTGYKDVGQSTTLKVVAVVEEASSGSRAALRGQWGAGADMALMASVMAGANVEKDTALRASWGGANRASVAFGQLAKIVGEIEGVRVEYATE